MQIPCLYATVIDEIYNDVYHIYIMPQHSFVKSERENRVLTHVPRKCWETLDKMRQKMMEGTA